MVKNSQPKFQSVYDYLVRGIESGFYRPETRLPSERKLAEKLNVNVATVRRAFRDLITSGVVEKRIGDGTYLTRLADYSRALAQRNRALKPPVNRSIVAAFEPELAANAPSIAALRRRP